MKCSKCGSKNITKANYCISCGNGFSEEERKKAKKKTVVGVLEFLEEVYSWCNLSKITGHIAFKIVSVLVVLLVGISFVFNNGRSVKILESDHYKIQYNTKDDEYYLLVDEDQTNLELYVPNKVSDLVIKEYDKDNLEISSMKYDPKNKLVLTVNSSDEYYMLVSKNGKAYEKIKMYVYRTGK